MERNTLLLRLFIHFTPLLEPTTTNTHHALPAAFDALVFYNVANEEADSTWLVCVGWSCCTGGRGSWDGRGLSKIATWKQERKS